MSHSHISLATQVYAAIEAADHETVRRLLAADVVWHVAGRSPLAADHRGIDAVLGLLARIYDLTDGTLRLQIDDVMADEAHAVVLMHSTATLAGQPFADQAVHVTLISGGGITDIRSFSSEQERWDQLIDEVLAARGT